MWLIVFCIIGINIIKIRQSVLDLQPFVDFQYGGRRHLEFDFNFRFPKVLSLRLRGSCILKISLISVDWFKSYSTLSFRDFIMGILYYGQKVVCFGGI
jgi:hypothetical protein